MIFYSNKNINKNYLCTYTKAVVFFDRTLFCNTLSGENITLKCTQEDGYELVNHLKTGMDDDELIKFMKERFQINEDGIEYMYKIGIIE